MCHDSRNGSISNAFQIDRIETEKCTIDKKYEQAIVTELLAMKPNQFFKTNQYIWRNVFCLQIVLKNNKLKYVKKTPIKQF